MFREMRRNKQLLSSEETAAVLERGTSGELALAGDQGYPYAVPISYVREGDTLYFHCAQSGHKLDAVARNEKASFCVIDQDQVVPERYTTHYRSVIAFGRIRIVEAPAEKRRSVELLARKYAPADTPEHRTEYIEKDFSRLCMLALTIEHVTGKQARELVPAAQ